jgi:hypothetical protein
MYYAGADVVDLNLDCFCGFYDFRCKICVAARRCDSENRKSRELGLQSEIKGPRDNRKVTHRSYAWHSKIKMQWQYLMPSLFAQH